MKVVVDKIDFMVKLISDYRPCPICGPIYRESGGGYIAEYGTKLLSTTNEWKGYCPRCDIRFNEKGQVQDPITLEAMNEEK